MLVPKRLHTRLRWRCPACTRADDPARPPVLGVQHPARQGGTYLLLTRLDVTVRGTGRAGTWLIICPCGEETVYRGAAVKWERPELAA